MELPPIYEENLVSIIQGNSLDLLKKMKTESIDVIATDPPFFLSNGGITCQSGKMVSVDKGDWDKTDSMTMDEFYYQFLQEAKRILKPNGTIWVFGTMHNIFSLGSIMQQMEFKILNNITWQKTNPAPNLSCRMFTHSTETIIWAKKNQKSKHLFNYQLMKEINNGKQMKDVWTTSTTKKSEKSFGKHPTQKPLEIMNKIILASTKEGDIILDPFMGSGTTLVSAKRLGRRAVGIDLENEYIKIAIERLKNM
ncbi:MAG: DNA-methyltransferase [Enterococcus lemanii]|jgi:site-specific DNA-methyltransferase (adenine-specific)